MKWIKALLMALVMGNTACAGEGLQKDTFTTPSGKRIEIYAIKHACIRIVFDGKEIEVDPVTSLKPATDYSTLPKADLILITHEHYDHLDAKAVKELSKPSTIIVTNQNCQKMLGKGEAIRNGDHKDMEKGIAIDAVPAYNITPAHTQFHPKGRDNGFVLSLDGFRIYIAGDTEDIEEMKDIKKIDVAFLPCNQPYTMTPEQLAKAAKVINPKVLFPYHYGDTHIQQVKDLLDGSGIDLRIRNYQ